MATTPDDRRSEVEGALDRTERDTVVATRMFLFVGSAVGTMSLIYLLTDDDAGQMMLGVASILGLVCGIYLWLHRVHGATDRIDEDELGRQGDDAWEKQYLPHASIWPFWIGVAAFLLTNGLILGTWFLVPGVVIMLAGVLGFVRQTRARS